MLVDFEHRAFLVPLEKRQKMKVLREAILSSPLMPLKTLQKWTGKCASVLCAVPQARMYIREANREISRVTRQGGDVFLNDHLREEIAYWSFLDDVDTFFPWIKEHHRTITLYSDASESGYGVVRPDGTIVTMDIWDEKDSRPIHVKEAQAAYLALLACAEEASNGRLQLYVDNTAVVASWCSGSRDPALNNIMKKIFDITVERSILLDILYVPSPENTADPASRIVSLGDAKLSEMVWSIVEARFGPHTLDAMASENNAKVARFFSRYWTPKTAGVDIFAQDLKMETNVYIYPPFRMIPHVLAYLSQLRMHSCTVVIPNVSPRPTWWPLVVENMRDKIVIGKNGATDIVSYPSRHGYKVDKKGLTRELLAVRLDFSNQSSR